MSSGCVLMGRRACGRIEVADATELHVGLRFAVISRLYPKMAARAICAPAGSWRIQLRGLLINGVAEGALAIIETGTSSLQYNDDNKNNQ